MSNHTKQTIALTGGGAAGLLFLHHFLQRPELTDRYQLHLFDPAEKNSNDHTWCFWERGAGSLDKYLFRAYKTLDIHADGLALRRVAISPYTYKHIRSLEFYRALNHQIAVTPEITRRRQWVDSVHPDGTVHLRRGTTERFDYVFNSVLFQKPDLRGCNYLDQHFRGWVVRTETDRFDPDCATFMDFRLPQENDTRFLYVLPHDRRTALVEIAVFSNEHWRMEDYDRELETYLETHLTDRYEVLEREHGIIPMTDAEFPKDTGRLFHFGTGGGDVKPSSGYAFYRIHQHAAALVEALAAGTLPRLDLPFGDARHRWMDRVFLNVLVQNRVPAARVFRLLFQRNTVPHVLSFLDEETSLLQDLRFMNQMPKLPFIRAAAREQLRMVGIG